MDLAIHLFLKINSENDTMVDLKDFNNQSLATPARKENSWLA